MSLWRREAIRRLPELQRQIADAEGPFLVWPILRHFLLLPACHTHPPDRRTAARIYDYAAWRCWRHPSLTIRPVVADEFYERLPDDPRTREDMPRWLSQEQFDSLAFVWSYLTPQNFEDLQREFMKNKARIDKETRC
jgi:hypothetical protein